MADVISAVALTATVWGFALHLLFDHRLRQRLRPLLRLQRRLMKRLTTLQKFESWVPANSAFSHAPWALVCLSGAYYRVSARHFYRREVESCRDLFTAAAASGLVYRHCFDLYGFFGDVGSYGSLKDLSDDGCRLLKLAYPVVFESESESDSAPTREAPVEPAVVDPTVVDPTVVISPSLLPPSFSSRFS